MLFHGISFIPIFSTILLISTLTSDSSEKTLKDVIVPLILSTPITRVISYCFFNNSFKLTTPGEKGEERDRDRERQRSRETERRGRNKRAGDQPCITTACNLCISYCRIMLLITLSSYCTHSLLRPRGSQEFDGLGAFVYNRTLQRSPPIPPILRP